MRFVCGIQNDIQILFNAHISRISLNTFVCLIVSRSSALIILPWVILLLLFFPHLIGETKHTENREKKIEENVSHEGKRNMNQQQLATDYFLKFMRRHLSCRFGGVVGMQIFLNAHWLLPFSRFLDTAILYLYLVRWIPSQPSPYLEWENHQEYIYDSIWSDPERDRDHMPHVKRPIARVYGRPWSEFNFQTRTCLNGLQKLGSDWV